MNEDNRKQIIDFRMENAQKTLKEVKILKENELWNTAINRLYYACYYATTALLVANKIEAQSHSGVRQMLALHFVKPGKLSKYYFNIYGSLFEKRQMSDYEDFVLMTKETVEEYYPKSIEYVEEIAKLLNN